MKRILKSVINFYNSWYGIINLLIGLCFLSSIKNNTLMIFLVVVIGLDVYTWYKNIFKNIGTKKDFFGTVKQNNSICLIGGTGSGKSTMAKLLLDHFIPKNKQYFNTNAKGYKAFTNKHLLLYDKLENGFGALVDEAGAQVDAYHYDKKDNDTRKHIDFLNKFIRHWYGSNCLLIYVDQAQSNMNTTLYKNVYYTVQCKGVSEKPSALIPHLIFKIFLFFVNRKREDGKKVNNPFTNVSIEFMEFVRLGDYADHYSVNIEDKDQKRLVFPIYKLFGGLNTYVFRDFNPAKDNSPYIWGTNKEIDKKIMTDNFGLDKIKEIKESFLK